MDSCTFTTLFVRVHVQPFCVAGQKDLACHRRLTKLSSPALKQQTNGAYDIQNTSNSAGWGWRSHPEKILKKKCFKFGDFLLGVL